MMQATTIVSAQPRAEQLAARAAAYQGFSSLFAGPVLIERPLDEYWNEILALLSVGIAELPYSYREDTLIETIEALAK